jgi:alcohol dehydrogenase class IV
MLWRRREADVRPPHLVPRIVLVDPELLLSLPAAVTTAGGFDALGHAIESMLSTFRTVTTSAARSAVVAVASAAGSGTSTATEARYGTALGTYQAGLALNASVVLGHSLAYAIAARTGLPHGVTVAMALPCAWPARPASEVQIAEMADRLRRPDPELLVRWIVEHSGGCRSRPRSPSWVSRAATCPRWQPTAWRPTAPEPPGADRPVGRASAARADVRQ